MKVLDGNIAKCNKCKHRWTTINGNTEQRKITDPDAHSPNWCTTQEMEDAIKEIFWNEEIQQYVFAFLGAMKGIEQNGAYECRAVYWFDN